MKMKKFTNLLIMASGVVLCTWCGECMYEDGVTYGHISNTSESETDSAAITTKGNAAIDGVDEAALFKQAETIARENQDRWARESESIPAGERNSRFIEFQQQYPTNVEVIFQQLKAKAVENKK